MKLNSGGFKDGGKERIIHTQNGNSGKFDIHTHISQLFDISDLSDSQIYILANLSLFPADGVEKKLFYDWCRLDTYEDINVLVEYGWITQSQFTYVALHPVISDVMRNILEQNLHLCETLLESANEYIRNVFPCETAEVRNRFIEIAATICSCLVKFKRFPYEGIVFINLCSGYISEYQLLTYSQWLQYQKKAIREYQLQGYCCDEYYLALHNNLACLYHDAGDLKRAEKYYNKVLKEAFRGGMENSPYCRSVRNNLATLYSDRGAHGHAKEIYESIIQMQSSQDIPAIKLATTYDNLGLAYQNLEQYSDAIKAHLEAQKILQAAGYDKSVHMAISYDNLGSAYQDLHDYSNAEIYFKKSLCLWQKLVGNDSVDTARAYHALGITYRDTEKYHDALHCFQSAIGIFEKGGNRYLQEVARTYSALGKTYEKQKLYMLADECYNKAIFIRTNCLGEEHELTKLVKERLNNLRQLID